MHCVELSKTYFLVIYEKLLIKSREHLKAGFLDSSKT